MPKPTLIVLYGPTAVGKTALSLSLANRYRCPIVNSDSRQIYQELRIGVAMPSPHEFAQADHRLFACKSVRDRYSAGQYEIEAIEELEQIYCNGDTALLVGGAMLYIDALLNGLDDFPPPDMELRESLNAQADQDGLRPLTEQLRLIDPVTHARIDLQNRARVLRAVEVTLQTNRPYSEWLNAPVKERAWRAIKVGLQRPWDELDARITDRIDKMMCEGLLEEVSRLQEFRLMPALRTVGYREVFDHLDGNASLSETLERIRVNTRRYAKRQIRWWQRDPGITWFDPSHQERLIEFVDSQLN